MVLFKPRSTLSPGIQVGGRPGPSAGSGLVEGQRATAKLLAGFNKTARANALPPTDERIPVAAHPPADPDARLPTEQFPEPYTDMPAHGDGSRDLVDREDFAQDRGYTADDPVADEPALDLTIAHPYEDDAGIAFGEDENYPAEAPETGREPGRMLSLAERHAARLPASLPPSRRSAPSRFEPEMRRLLGKIQPLIAERSSVMLAMTATSTGEGTSMVSRLFAEHAARQGLGVLLATEQARIAHEDAASGLAEAGVPMEIGTAFLREAPSLAECDAFREFLHGERVHFDLIVVDCPPVTGADSWLSLLADSDGVILVAAAEETRGPVMRRMVGHLEDAGGHIIGVVFNKRRQRIPRLLYRLL